MLTEIKGNLITLALQGKFDVIAHGCNCFCRQGAGIAKDMAAYFHTNDPARYPLESYMHKGEHDKLGRIQSATFSLASRGLHKYLSVVNCYTQYTFKTKENPNPLNLAALDLCLVKLNGIYAGKVLGLPWMGCGLAGGDIDTLRRFIRLRMTDVNVVLVEYDRTPVEI